MPPGYRSRGPLGSDEANPVEVRRLPADRSSRSGGPLGLHAAEPESAMLLWDFVDLVTPIGIFRELAERIAYAAELAALKANIVRIAREEWERWNIPRRRTERDRTMRATLQDYWQTGVNLRYTDAQLSSRDFQDDHPWSAAFISWVMRQAGAGDRFRYSASHSNYIVAAKRNREEDNDNPFRAYRLNEAVPELGELVCKSRAGSGATYDNIRPGMRTHCDIVTEVHPDHLISIGGNVSNSVSQTRVSLDESGHVNQARYFAVIKIEARRSTPAPHPAP